MTVVTTFLAGPDNLVAISRPTPDPSLPGVLMVHGASGTHTYGTRTGEKGAVLARTLAERGHVVIAGDFGGPQTWGNDTAMARMDEAYTRLGTLGAGPGVVLCGGSMGACNSLVWASRNRDKVVAVVGSLPLLSVDDVWHSNAQGCRSLIDSAYASRGGWKASGYLEHAEPIRLARAGRFDGLPIHLTYGDADALAHPRFAREFSALSPAVVAVPVSGGHTIPTYDLISSSAQAAFIAAATA